MATDLALEVTAPVVASRPWSAIDVDAEARIDREVSRPATRRQMIVRWLIEFNKY